MEAPIISSPRSTAIIRRWLYPFVLLFIYVACLPICFRPTIGISSKSSGLFPSPWPLAPLWLGPQPQEAPQSLSPFSPKYCKSKRLMPAPLAS